MSLASGGFLLFLGLGLLGNRLLPRWRAQVLLALSLGFYAWCGWRSLGFIAATTLTSYAAGRLLSESGAAASRAPRPLTGPGRKLAAGLCLGFNLGLLLALKLLTAGPATAAGASLAGDPAGGGLAGVSFAGGLPFSALPLGLSFYTFQTQGYVIDCYRGRVRAEKSLWRFALFACFFPQLFLGPISRYEDLAPALLHRPREKGRPAFSPLQGKGAPSRLLSLERLLWGFFKKLVVADRLLPLTRDLATGEGPWAALCLLVYALALYADFTGGIDIVLGGAGLLGVPLPENFNRPFLAVSVADYWRRWHITMGAWFRDYLFYPLSTCRPMLRLGAWLRRRTARRPKALATLGKKLPVWLCILAVWLATGLWHGLSANFIAWGLANGLVIIASDALAPLWGGFHRRFPGAGARPLYRAFTVARTFCLMGMIRAFDVYPGVGTTLRRLASVFTGGPGALGEALATSLSAPELACGLAGAAVMLGAALWQARSQSPRKTTRRGRAAGELPGEPGSGGLAPAPGLWPVAWRCLALFFAVLVFGAYGQGYDPVQFIYNQF